MLLARDVVKSFDGSVALAGASFDLMAGDVHALVGANGAGKSTFSRILSGRIRPDSGTIELAGTPVVFGSARDALRAGIAIVMQETSLVPDLSVLAGSLLVGLLWIYYSAIILLLGAECTKVAAGRVETVAPSSIRSLSDHPAGVDPRSAGKTNS